MISILTDIRDIKSGRKELREFGFTIGIVLLVLAGFALWRGKASGAYLLTTGFFFIGFGAAVPQALKPLQKIWMAFSVVMGFFMSRLILAILFFGVITPIGLLMKLFKQDVLDRRMMKGASSYWHERPGEAKTKESYENQY